MGQENTGERQGGGSSITLELRFRVLREIQAEQREQRIEQRDMRSLLLAQVDQGRRTDRRLAEMERRLAEMKRRLSELRDDLELMLKAELMGRLGHLETQTGHRFDELSDRMSEMEGGPHLHKPGL